MYIDKKVRLVEKEPTQSHDWALVTRTHTITYSIHLSLSLSLSMMKDMIKTLKNFKICNELQQVYMYRVIYICPTVYAINRIKRIGEVITPLE